MLPGWATSLHPEDDRDDQRIREMTPDERLAELVEILILMESILEGRPDREEELARRDPLAEGWLEIDADRVTQGAGWRAEQTRARGRS